MASKTKILARKRDSITRMAAEIHHVSMRYVQMVRSGERENEQIMTTVMDLIEGQKALVKKVAELVPFDETEPKRPRNLANVPPLDPKNNL